MNKINLNNLININQGVEKLLAGEVIAVPTESVYGLSVDARNPKAVEQLLNLKGRGAQKGLIIITDELERLENLNWIKKLDLNFKKILQKSWPGPVTYLLPLGDACPDYLKGQHESLAVRLSNHPVLLALAQNLKHPLVSTSANFQGEPPAKSAQQVWDYFGPEFLVLEGDLGNLKAPTSIFDLLSGVQIR